MSLGLDRKKNTRSQFHLFFQNLFEKKRVFGALLLFLFFSVKSFALQADSKEIIHILADSSLVDYKSGINVYEGNVKVDQGTTYLTAERVVTKNNAKHKIEEAIAYGSKRLAEYTTIPKEGDKLLRAQAKVIKFYPQKTTLILEGDVKVTQGENSFNGAVIIYNTKDQIISAPASKGGRSKIIIDPKQLS